jgi:hypothetical protein
MMLPPLTGLFLGAGASYEAGMPLVWELTGEIKDWLTAEKLRELNQGWRAQNSGFSDEVIEDLISVLVRNDLHYENILGHLETQFRRQQVEPQDYHGLYSWLVELVYHLLYVRQVSNDTLFEQQLRFYEGIRTLANAHCPLWIFSLNHDVLIEAIAARFSIPLHSGFSPRTITLPRRDHTGAVKGELTAEVLTQRELDTHAMYFPNPFQKGIYLLKIHGALDVFTFNEGNDLLKLLPVGPGQKGVFDSLRAANEELIYLIPGAPGGRAKALNEIAYADADGVMQFLRRSLLAGAFKFDARRTQVLPKSLLRHFRENLNFVTRLVCLGYGFGDSHVNDVIRAWLEWSADRRLEIVSPHAKDIPPSFLHLAPQVEVLAKKSTDWLDGNAGIVRPRIELLRKRVFDHIRSLSKKQREIELSDFMEQERERTMRAAADKIVQRALIAGTSDHSSIDDPHEAAKRLALELGGTEEEVLERMNNFFDDRVDHR